MRCFYLNRQDRVDRREHMIRLLQRLGWSHHRIDAVECTEARGFFNGRVRGNWLSHEHMIEKSLQYTEPVLILEDDVSFCNVEKIVQYTQQVQTIDWDALYFYGARSLDRIMGVIDFHAYIVNKKAIPGILTSLREYRLQIESKQPCNTDTFIDQYFSKVLQQRFKFWGTEPLICQDRERFGSETGWRSSLLNTGQKKRRRLVFGCAIYREGPKLLGSFLESVRAQYPDESIFVISDGIQNAEYPKVCAEYRAEYVLGERLKILDKGGAWWYRHLKKAASYDCEYFFKIDPDTRLHRTFRYFPDFEFFGSKDSINIQGGIQGFRRSAIDKIIRSQLLESPVLSKPETWARHEVTSAYVRETGQISTDFILMHIVHRLGLSWGNWTEVDSQWHANRPFRQDAAATHPHKR